MHIPQWINNKKTRILIIEYNFAYILTIISPKYRCIRNNKDKFAPSPIVIELIDLYTLDEPLEINENSNIMQNNKLAYSTTFGVDTGSFAASLQKSLAPLVADKKKPPKILI